MERETGRKERAQKDIYFLMGKMKEILDICINLGIMELYGNKLPCYTNKF